MAEYRVLVTGSRTWDAVTPIWNALNDLLREHGNIIVVHGHCPKGADHIADSWAVAMQPKGAGLERHPADWDRYGKAAGFRRNAAMVALGADVCLCFAMPCADSRCTRPGPHDSHGAGHCADVAKLAGIPLRRFAP